ncbi:hypothetical protein AX17_002945 [Amanita inopinata Kibby_2008]|nr:hypothetical protein AX17_002945 [Amanita inopinata Kibby_2008]
MEANELARWTRFAAKGGIGRCTALSDCIAENEGDLMFLKGDEITVLMQLNDQEEVYLGYCEGVVGRFSGSGVRFHAKLKKPVMTKRSSASTTGVKQPSSKCSSAAQSPVLQSSSNTGDEKSHRPSLSYSTSIDSVIIPANINQLLEMKPKVYTSDTSPVHSKYPTGQVPPSFNQSYVQPKSAAPLVLKKKPSQSQSSPPRHRVQSLRSSRSSDPSTTTPHQSDIPPVDEEQPPLAQEVSYATHEDPSTRVSPAYSDGEMGIGLTMLQSLANGEDDDDDDDDWSPSGQHSVKIPYSYSQFDALAMEHDGKMDENGPSEINIRNKVAIPSRSPSPASSSKPGVPPDASSQEASDARSHRQSLAPSASSGSWEDAADIYDDYRYSRFSIASKLSRMSLSTMGGITTTAEELPPMPDPRPSIDSRPSISSRPSLDSRPSMEVDAVVQPPPRMPSLDSPPPRTQARKVASRPTVPLTLRPRHKPSVQTNLVAPVSPISESSMTPASATFLPPGLQTQSNNVLLKSPSLSNGNVDSVLQSPGMEEPLPPSATKDAGGEKDEVFSLEDLARQIVVDDDEELPSRIISSPLHESPLSSPEPSLDESDGEKVEHGKMDGSISKESGHTEAGVVKVGSPPDTFSPPSPVILSPPLPTSTSSTASPSLSELRGERMPGSGQRLSLFLPHPNAPKAPPAPSPGPMYIQSPQERSMGLPAGPIRPNSVHVLRMALSRLPTTMVGRGAPLRGITIYGRTEVELCQSPEPVPIIFSLEPHPATAPPPGSLHQPVGLPQRMAPPFLRPATAPNQHKSGIGPGMERKILDGIVEAPLANQAERAVTLENPGTPNVIPRANFFPKRPGARPRSRSFSGFDSVSVQVPLPTQKSHMVVNDVPDLLSVAEIKRSLSSNNLSASVPSSPTSPSPSSHLPVTSKIPSRLSPLRPSPLSLPQNNVSREDKEGKKSVDPIKSPVINLDDLSPSMPLPTATVQPLQSPVINVGPKLNLSDSSSSRPSIGSAPPAQQPPQDGSLLLADLNPGKARLSIDTDAMSMYSDSRSLVSSSAHTTIVRNNSLRSKLSLPNLRKNRSRQDETSSLCSASHMTDFDTVQVEDMDFELVRPNIPQLYAGRKSEDSGVSGREGFLDAHGSLLSPSSPAPSTFSGRSPTISSDTASWQSPRVPDPPPKPSAETEQMIDAHRQRELKWVSLMSTVLPSQSRKNKKVKKLLLDGVPASVRYLVWSHVTDGKARLVPGVYSQLSSRGRVPASELIEKDVHRRFRDNPELQGPPSPILTLLQAYLNMVPDVQYTTGLTLIVGQLLLQGPEEEVFWIFVSLMDTYLRRYFSSSSQLEVDSALFSRALENNDPQVAKKILMDMSIPPGRICAAWFTSVFVDTLPTDYVNRIWDVFMYEGVPFLIRVGLVIVKSCRRRILECNDDDAIIDLLHHPPVMLLPAHPDGLVTSALNQKLKDDDVRKQRIKMETQVKLQAQAQMIRKTAASSSISLPRT